MSFLTLYKNDTWSDDNKTIYIYIYIYNIDFSNSPTKLLGQLMKLPKISTEKKNGLLGWEKATLKKEGKYQNEA